MATEYTTASIFDIDVEALVNPVNCVGVSGAGLAWEFGRRFPNNDRLYKQACAAGRISPGRGLITETEMESPRYIVNFPTKRHWRNPSRLDDIETGLANLHRELRRRNIRSVAMPALGAGLGGQRWHVVRQLIEREFSDEHEIEITVCMPK